MFADPRTSSSTRMLSASSAGPRSGVEADGDSEHEISFNAALNSGDVNVPGVCSIRSNAYDGNAISLPRALLRRFFSRYVRQACPQSRFVQRRAWKAVAV